MTGYPEFLVDGDGDVWQLSTPEGAYDCITNDEPTTALEVIVQAFAPVRPLLLGEVLG